MQGHPHSAEQRFMLDNPLKNNQDYQFLSVVGQGSFGLVVAAKERATNKTVAIKFLPLGKHLDLLRVQREIFNQMWLIHHHVITFERVILTPNALGVVMEYAEGGNLKEYVVRHGGRIDPALARRFFQQLVVAMEYCHGMHVANRDIKLQNCLLTGDENWPLLKICDFGFSKHEIADSFPNSIVGSRAYMAPEVVSLTKEGVYDGVKADIWGLGLFLYSLVVGSNPFYGPDEQLVEIELIRRIFVVDYKIPDWIPGDCSDLIGRILVQNPDERPTIEQIKTHPYFTSDLPAGAATLNDQLCSRHVTQSVDEINRILLQAKRATELKIASEAKD